MTQRSVTAQYPDVKPELPPRSRGVIALMEENCTSCMLCARECPDWCIYIDSHKEVVPATEPGQRDRTRNVLDRFAIDYSLCMYCGICIEVCPFDALFWSPEFEYAEFDIVDLLHEKDRLREWMWTVPEPPAYAANAEPPKELATAEKTVEKARTAVAKAAEAAEAAAAKVEAEAAERAAAEAAARVEAAAKAVADAEAKAAAEAEAAARAEAEAAERAAAEEAAASRPRLLSGRPWSARRLRLLTGGGGEGCC